MRRALVLCLTLAACSAKAGDVTISAAGLTAADVMTMKTELEKIEGVSNVRLGAFADGQVTVTVAYTGSGSDLAAALTRGSTGLKNVTAFDGASVRVSWDGTSVPAAPAGGTTPAAPAQPPPPAPKDGLAYRIHNVPGGSIAKFDNWTITPVSSDGALVYDTAPQGREKDFAMRVALAIPTASELAQLFTAGPQLVQQILPGFRRVGSPERLTIAGDEAMQERYEGSPQGTQLMARALYIRKSDVAVAVLGIGSEKGHKEFGRAVDILAQSITLKESALEAGVLGTWTMSSFRSSGSGSTYFSYSSATSLTIYANGTFTEYHSSSAGGPSTADAYLENGKRGRVVCRGTTLTFHYDNGEVWNAEYRLEGGALLLNGKLWTRN